MQLRPHPPSIFSRLAARLVCIALVLWVGASLPNLDARQTELRGGWSLWIPYQYEETTSMGVHVLTGLDVEVMKAVARRSGFQATFHEVAWGDSLAGIRAGTQDFALAAKAEESRHEWAWFTEPYRKEYLTMFSRKGEGDFKRSESTLQSLRRFLEA